MKKVRGGGRFGFTLVEMSVVVAIIGVLYVTVVPMYGKTIIRTKETTLKNDLYIFRTTLNNYFKDHEKWPETIESLVSEGYIRAVPPDPFTEKNDTWVTVPSEAGKSDVYDIRSGADGVALDGVRYADF
ncbi:MAG: prepilin-type N-terminal cleavage/methylation domain-containing protein [Candidatus Riflebacteria bacterium]|nr:prepilin-type N-terminal cleavage/methylation domain-containing protein [Candidatus Riflebacteria bacterium]